MDFLSQPQYVRSIAQPNAIAVVNVDDESAYLNDLETSMVRMVLGIAEVGQVYNELL